MAERKDMKVYTITMKSDNETEMLKVLVPIERGTEIGWGEDKKTGEVRTWIVTDCKEEEI